MKFVKKNNKVYRVKEEVDVSSETERIDTAIAELERKRDAKIYQINSAFNIKIDKLNEEKDDLSKV